MVSNIITTTIIITSTIINIIIITITIMIFVIIIIIVRVGESRGWVLTGAPVRLAAQAHPRLWLFC